ncbi:DNA polymerase III subunit delta' C-terminal domain-containing protein [Candidatus Blochmannia ocreatus (nom. nud.)]|uniref:DNA polymerase III subunit delta' n=1 Tax=Candidatus Blochmannia ocreatus (nom. nud.) TaxID=251538 RepID=A0ABY4SSE0_9ENTR|nr:DNA polymerase III subunit delta' C-terminal domain-containing protein [Candidatus Blochmannia ocreatus]URJ24905.1 DNA polymerase III subunit delta' [Candidatus Blochmannia ocreatus]
MYLYPWLSYIYNKILGIYKNKKGHHALLFSSKQDNGVDVLIYFIIRWLFCMKPYNTKYCNACYDCKLMHVGNHPNYYDIIAKDSIGIVGVDTIRVCINSIYKCAYANKTKIVFVRRLECLTDAAVNSLLKIIDEPPVNTFFFFHTKDYNQVSMTLLSRCMRWCITSPKEEIGLRWLMKQQVTADIVSARCALRLCDGFPIAAKNIFKSNLWEQRLELFKFTYTIITNGDFLKLSSRLSYIENMCLYWLITIILDALKWKQGVKNIFLMNLDQLELISAIADRWDILSLSDHLQKWWVLLRCLKQYTNINRELLLTYRLLNWKYDITEDCLNSWSI